ncbi:MAG: DUF1641 domain-containing protein [Gemmatimonadales bacterium]|nr:DUF1641 domain-containing protein [Gemmatimonadales bacterium]
MTAPTASAEALLDRLSEPATAAALHKLLDKLETIAFAAEALDGLVRRSDTVIESVGSSLGDFRRLAATTGLGDEVLPRLPQISRAVGQLSDLVEKPEIQRLLDSGVIEELGKPETIAALRTVMQHAELLAFVVSALDGLVRRGDHVVESVVGTINDLRRAFPPGERIRDVQQVYGDVRVLVKSWRALSDAGVFEHLDQVANAVDPVIQSGMLEPKTVGALGEIGAAVSTAYQETKQATPEPLGLLGLMRALRDPDVQHTVGFAVEFARRYARASRKA